MANHLGLRRVVGQKNQISCFREFNAEFMKSYSNMMDAVGVEVNDLPSTTMATTSRDSFSSLDSATEAIVQQGT